MIGLWLLVGLSGPVNAAEDLLPPETTAVDATGVIGEPGPPVTDTAELDARERAIGLILRCPVCQGLSVADSSSDAARAMSARVRELVAAGYDDQQVLDFFADRYGDFILLAPPKEGVHWLLWAGPMVAVGAGLLWLLARTRRTGGSAAAPVPAPDTTGPETPADDDYRARILAELKD